MTAPDIAQIARSLTKAQRQYVAEGPFPLWTSTRKALARRMLVKANGKLGATGLAVRDWLKENGQ